MFAKSLLLALGLAASASALTEVTTTQIGVLKKVEDCKLKVLVGDHVQYHYTATLAATGEEFDNSYKRGQLWTSLIGSGSFDVPGVHKGMIGMCVGEKRKLTIPPAEAFGEHGVGDKIPPNATVIYEIELHQIRPGDGHFRNSHDEL